MPSGRPHHWTMSLTLFNRNDRSVPLVLIGMSSDWGLPITKVQAKSARATSGARSAGAAGVSRTRRVRTTGDDYGFSQQARELAKAKSSVRQFDGEELVGLILEHYEDLAPLLQSADLATCSLQTGRRGLQNQHSWVQLRSDAAIILASTH